MEWVKIRKRQKIVEIIWLIAMLSTIIIGVVCEICVENGRVFLLVKELSTISLTILQIQATIVSLSISVIALISGQMDKSYMGVSYNAYWSDIKPWFFTQKKIVIGSIALIPISIVVHMLELYNIVISCLVISIILICISILHIYKIFVETRLVENEIKLYFEYQVNEVKHHSPKQTQMVIRLMNNFVDDWKSKMNQQSMPDFESEMSFLLKCGRTILRSGNDEDLSAYESKCEFMVASYLNTESINHRGLILIQDIYSDLWSFILNNQEIVKKFKNPFALYTNISYDLWKVVTSLPINIAEKYVELDVFCEDVLRTGYHIGYGTNKVKNTAELLNEYARSIGRYVSKQENAKVNSAYWEKPFKGLSDSAFSIPKEYASDFRANKAKIYLHYAIGFIIGGRADIVKEGLYYIGYKSIFHFDSAEMATFPLMLHCYIYYLAEWEKTSCISEELIQTCKTFLSDKNVKISYNRIIQLAINHSVLNHKLYNIIFDALRRLEFFPRYDNAKIMIMDDVVRIFVYYSMLYYGESHSDQNIIDEIPKVAEDIYALQLIEDEKNNEKVRLKTFIEYQRIFNNESNEERVDFLGRKTTELFNVFEKCIADSVKNKAIQEASEAQVEFDKVGSDEYQRTFEKTIGKFLNNRFSKLFSKVAKNARKKECCIFSLTLRTQDIGEEMLKESYSYIESAFVDALASLLMEYGMLECKNKNEFDDEALIDYLKSKKITHLLGGRHIYFPKHYSKNIKAYNEFADQVNTEYLENGSILVALNLNKLKLSFEGVKVHIRDLRIDEVSLVKNDETGKFEYPIINEYRVGFDKNELSNYIQRRSKVVEIYVRLAVNVKKKPIGVGIKW